MSFLKNRYKKEGPGISKEEPKKKGLALFFDILLREFWNLIKLNLIFILFCLPIVTIFPAITAMTYVITKMIRDENTYVFSDFWKAFRENWKQSYLIGIILFISILSIGSNLYLYLMYNKTLFLVCGFLLHVIVSLFAMNAFPLMAAVDLSPKVVIKNALLLSGSCINYLLPALIISDIILYFALGYFFLALPFYVFILFSLLCLINTFAAWAGIQRYVIVEKDQEETD